MSIDNILSVLWAFESAPGAHCMVKSIVGFAPTHESEDSFRARVYECTESYNDYETGKLVRAMSPSKLKELVDLLKDIDAEYKVSYGEDYEERVGGLDVADLLS